MRKKLILILFPTSAFIYFLYKDPNSIHQSRALENSSGDFILGTDYLGRDLFSRLLVGFKNSIFLGFLTLLCIIIVSLVLGGLAGYFGRYIDTSIVFVADVLTSLPSMILSLVFIGFFVNSTWTVVFALVISWSGRYIRYIRNLVIWLKKEAFINLAPLRGSKGWHVLIHHFLPNLIYPLCSLFLTDIGKIVLSISGLAFLGLGVQPPTAELGTILYDGKAYFFTAPWLFLYPGLLLGLFVLLTQIVARKVLLCHKR